MMLVQMVSTCIFWLNVFPLFSRNINPRELITGTKIDYKKHIWAEFGEYLQIHEEHNNTMPTRTMGAIATKPTGNAKGGHWFNSLNTSRILDRRRWKPLPMPAEVIELILVLAKAGQVGLNFTNMQNEIYSEEEDQDSDNDYDDSDYSSDEESSNSEDNDYDDFITGVDMDCLDPNDPPDNGSGETHNNNDIDVLDEDDNNIDYASDDSDDDTYDVSDNVTDNGSIEDNTTETPIVSPVLRNLRDDTGTLPPVIQSRTRQQAQETGESLAIGATVGTVVTKKQRKFRKELQI
jgi:hypothetical protein